MHNDSVWLKKLDPIITEHNYSKTKYDLKTNSWFRFISTSYNASSDNVTPETILTTIEELHLSKKY